MGLFLQNKTLQLNWDHPAERSIFTVSQTESYTKRSEIEKLYMKWKL